MCCGYAADNLAVQFNDILISQDGVTWITLTVAAPFTVRRDAAVTIAKNSIIIAGKNKNASPAVAETCVYICSFFYFLLSVFLQVDLIQY
jgi:hypothetical protein